MDRPIKKMYARTYYFTFYWVHWGIRLGFGSGRASKLVIMGENGYGKWKWQLHLANRTIKELESE